MVGAPVPPYRAACRPYEILGARCNRCGACIAACPEEAIVAV
ncbi:MAG: 4Fe-4S binding protein [Bacillota bacterium]